jgi:Flp pilus assembly protein protease CpaA
LGLALYDFRTQQVPNLITLPLLVIALTWHFPGTLTQWVGTGLLFAAWYGQALGGGDAKLWMALLWLTPPKLAATALLVMAIVLMGTAVLQLAWRYLRRKQVFGVKSPGAWRAIPFVIWLIFVGG